ncbi:hypothetical protein CRG98_043324 [Punica granatum]|uniref:Uncharacterized protein n=1 Tax=Punica granatum TaxID=22663 RepID=A0A2I0HX90_PUNGR|nr:hypothetical protein CRG98_043324 [Punica granatum]
MVKMKKEGLLIKTKVTVKLRMKILRKKMLRMVMLRVRMLMMKMLRVDDENFIDDEDAEEIRMYIMRKMNATRDQNAKYKGPITLIAQSKLEEAKRASHSWYAMWVGDRDISRFQVQHIHRRSEKYDVDLKEHTCFYRNVIYVESHVSMQWYL